MTLRSHKYAVLLAAIVGVILVESFSHRLLLGPVASDLAVLSTQLLVFLIVFDRRVNRLVGLIAFATAVASALAHYVLPPTYPQVQLRLIYHSALLLLLGFAVIVILRNIFAQRVVRSDDVLGAVCGYLLAAGAWSNLFMLIEVFVPGSYSVGQGFGVAARQLGRAHRRDELRQSRFTDGRWLGCGRAGPPARYRVDHARSGVRTVLHCRRGRAARGREALP